jgi:hypothetical protein
MRGSLDYSPSGLHSRLSVIRKGSVENYVIFLVALVVAMMTSTARSESAHAVGILILTHIIFGGMMVTMGNGFPVRFTEGCECSIHPALVIAARTIYISPARFCSWF